MTLDPAKKWSFFVVPHTHLDIGLYRSPVQRWQRFRADTLDEAIQLIHDHPNFRFSTDSFWNVREFLAGRSDQQKQRLFQAVKEKKIFVPTVEANLLTGISILETLLRSLYPAFEVNRSMAAIRTM